MIPVSIQNGFNSWKYLINSNICYSKGAQGIHANEQFGINEKAILVGRLRVIIDKLMAILVHINCW